MPILGCDVERRVATRALVVHQGLCARRIDSIFLTSTVSSMGFFLFDRRFESAGGYIHKYVFGQANLQIQNFVKMLIGDEFGFRR